jgi:hypothetical protein
MAPTSDALVPSPPSAAPHFRCNPEVLTAQFDGDLIFLHPIAGRYFATDARGAQIWEAIGPEGEALEAIVEGLLCTFEVESALCRDAVSRFLAALEAGQLVETTEGAPRAPRPMPEPLLEGRLPWDGEIQLVSLDLAATGSGPFVFDNEMLDMLGRDMGGPIPS